MAKKWTPSIKQLSLYDELLKRQNITRKRLLKRRKKAEEETSFGRSLPDLVIPMKAKRYRDLSRYSPRFDSYEDYRNKIRALQNLYGGKDSPEIQWYKVNYRQNILNLIKGWISDELGFNQKPQGGFGRYSEEQIDIANQVSIDGGRFLILYNKMISLSMGEFMAMYDSGFFPKLKYIYEEMRGIGGVEFSYVDEFIDSFRDYRRQVREQQNIFVKPIESRRGYNK